jgi:hypothetical protein
MLIANRTNLIDSNGVWIRARAMRSFCRAQQRWGISPVVNASARSIISNSNRTTYQATLLHP